MDKLDEKKPAEAGLSSGVMPGQVASYGPRKREPLKWIRCVG